MLYVFNDAFRQYARLRVGAGQLERISVDFTNKSWAEPIATQTQYTGPLQVRVTHSRLNTAKRQQQQAPPDPRAENAIYHNTKKRLNIEWNI